MEFDWVCIPSLEAVDASVEIIEYFHFVGKSSYFEMDWAVLVSTEVSGTLNLIEQVNLIKSEKWTL